MDSQPLFYPQFVLLYFNDDVFNMLPVAVRRLICRNNLSDTSFYCLCVLDTTSFYIMEIGCFFMKELFLPYIKR